MKDENEIWKIIGDKLRNHEAAEASDADWEAFREAYLPAKRRRVLGLWFWLPVLGLTLLLSSVFVFTIGQDTTPMGSSAHTMKSVDAITSKVQSSTTIITTQVQVHPSEKNKQEHFQIHAVPHEEKSLSTLLIRQHSSNKKHSITHSNKKKNRVEKAKEVLENKNDQVSNKIETYQVYSQKNREEQPHLSTEILIKDIQVNTDTINNEKEKKNPILDTLQNEIPSDSIIAVTIHSKKQRKSFLPLSYIDLQAIMSPNPGVLNTLQDINYLGGFGLQAAFGIKKHKFISSGISYLMAYQQRTEKRWLEHTYSSISKIDTSLKFDLASSTIMMNIDTHYQNHTGNVEKTFSIVRKSQFISIPVIFTFETGNPTSQVSLYGGVQNDWLKEESTILNQTDKTTQTFTSHKLLVAPLAGMSYSKSLMGNWALNLGFNYRYYLSGGLERKDYWQLQAGFRYHLK